MSLSLSSTAFQTGEGIPTRFTCDGEDLSPPLSWSGVPDTALSLALIVDDPDAPGRTWVHWVLFNLPSDQISLSEGAQGDGVSGKNDFRRLGYGGPCPPAGKPHRYYFKLYALDLKLSLKEGASKSDLEAAMKGHVLTQGELMGTYGR